MPGSLTGELEAGFHQTGPERCQKLAHTGLKNKARTLLTVITSDPFQNPPPYEKLVGDLAGAYSRRINIHHRLVYQVLKEERTVKVIRMWTHYQ